MLKDPFLVKGKKVKPLLMAAALLLVGACLFSYGFAVGKYQLPPYSLLRKAKNMLNPTPIITPASSSKPLPELQDTTALEKIVELVRQQSFSSPSEEIDFVRDFIHTNSIHKSDDEFWEYAYDTPRVLEMMYGTYENGDPPPHMLCDTRTYAMKAIIQALGYHTRDVHVFSDDYETMQSHTFLEVFNEKTQMWEIQDPDYNLYYIDSRTSERLSVTHLIMGDMELIKLVSSSPEQVDAARNKLMKHYYEAAVVLGAPEHSFIVINTARFSLEDSRRYFGDEESVNTYFDYVKEHFGYYPFIVAQGFESPD